MRRRGMLVFLGTFLTVICGLGSGHAQGATPSFTIEASNTTMPTSGAGAISFTLTSVNGFAGMVGIDCGPANPPTGSILPQCNYTGGGPAPQPYTLAANGTVRGSLNLVAYVPPCSNPCPVKLLRPPSPRGVNLALAGVLLLGLPFRWRARRLRLSLLVVGIMAGLAGIACGAGNNDTLTPGTFVYTVSASQVGTAATLATSATVKVTVPAGIATNLSSANP